MDSLLNKSQLPLKGMKGRPCDDDALSGEVKKEIGRLYLKGDIPDEAAVQEVAMREAGRLRKAKQRERDKVMLEQEKEYQKDSYSDKDPFEGLNKDVEEDDIVYEASRKAEARRKADRLRKAKKRARDMEKLVQEKNDQGGIKDRQSDDEAIEEVKEEMEELDTLYEADKKEAVKREAGRLKQARHRAKEKEKKKLEQEYQESSEDRLSDDDVIEDLKKEMEEDDILDEATRKAIAKREASRLRTAKYRAKHNLEQVVARREANRLRIAKNRAKDNLEQVVARREADRLRKAKQRAGAKEKSEQECDSQQYQKDTLSRKCAVRRSDDEVKLRKELIQEVHSHSRIWDITHVEYRKRDARQHDWQSIFKRMRENYESNPEILVKCRADTANKIRKTWHVLSTHHNIIWKKKGWNDSDVNLTQWPYWEVFKFYRQNGPPDETEISINKKHFLSKNCFSRRSDDDVLVRNALIREVKDYPSLWDKNHPHFKKMVLRNYDCQDVMDKLREAFKTNPNILTKCEADSVRKIRKVWRDLFKRHNEMWNPNVTDAADGKFKHWPYWDAFQYVRQPRDTVNSDAGGKTRWLKCGQCPFKVIHEDSKASHEINNHRWKYHKGFFCEFCAFSTPVKTQFTDHVNTVHLNKKMHKCDKCDFVSGHYSNLRQHKKKHGDHISKRGTPNQWICDQCGCKFYQRNQLREHIDAKHMGKKPYPCELCDFAAGFRTNLYAHVRKTHGTKVSRVKGGSKEGRWFKDSKLKWEHKAESLHALLVSNNFDEVKQDEKVDVGSQNHMIEGIEQDHVHIKGVHDKLKDNICDQCGAAYIHKKDLTRHIRNIHLNIKDVGKGLHQEEREVPDEELKDLANDATILPSESKDKGELSEQSDQDWSLGHLSEESDQEDKKLPSMKEEKMEMIMEVSSKHEELENASNDHEPHTYDDDRNDEDIGLADDDDLDDGQIAESGDCDDFDFTGLDELVFSHGLEKESNQNKDEKMAAIKENIEEQDFTALENVSATVDPHLETDQDLYKKEIHEETEFFQCEMCGYESADRNSVALHKKSVHDIIRDSICDECGRAFSDPQTKRKHVRDVHGKVEERDFQRDNIEDVIENEVNKNDEVVEGENPDAIKVEPSLEDIVGDGDDAQSFDEENNKEDILKEMHETMVDPNDDFFPCLLCGKTYSHKTSLTRHLEKDHCNKKFPCQYCDKVYTNSFYFKKHMKRVHENVEFDTTFRPKAKGKCSICGEKFYSKEDYKVHVETAHLQTKAEDASPESYEEVKQDDKIDDRDVMPQNNNIKSPGSAVEEVSPVKKRRKRATKAEMAERRAKAEADAREQVLKGEQQPGKRRGRKPRPPEEKARIAEEKRMAYQDVPDEDEQGIGVSTPLPTLVNIEPSSSDSMESTKKRPIRVQKKKRKRRFKTEMKDRDEYHICEECGSSFKRKEKLEVHKKRTHQNIRNFQCDQCPLAFFYNSQLEEHVQRVHLKLKDTGTGLKPLHNSNLP